MGAEFTDKNQSFGAIKGRSVLPVKLHQKAPIVAQLR